MNRKHLEDIFSAQSKAHESMVRESSETILKIAASLAECLGNDHKVMLFGNGGSAADAQHVAAELVGRFARERNAWSAIALTTDTSILTAIGNDYGFDRIFVRQLEAHAKPDDIAVGISTSGNSPNVLRALEWARERKVLAIGFTGFPGGKLAETCDICFRAPAEVTARIQELHIAAWHAICELVEKELTDKS